MEIMSLTVLMIFLSCYGTSKGDITDAMLKLVNYGYLNKAPDGTGLLVDPSATNSAIRNFQSYARLRVTGVLDKATVAKLQEPRCGMADPKFSKREKRYVHQGTKWTKQRLTYKILDYSRKNTLRKETVRRVIYKALSKWMKVTNLDFAEVASNDADIIIRFVSRKHNDPYAFDGRGGTLAHAFYPMNNRGLAGDAHFDDDEDFTLRSERGTNFYWVALHEFGHSIGMEHSNQLGAVMYPWYQGYKGDDTELTADDITGIQELYGKRKPEKATTTTQPNKPIATVLPSQKKGPECINRIKAVLLGRDQRSYVINDDKVYVLGKHLKVEQGPFETEKFFPGLKKVDVAIKAENGDVIFFHGDKYWIFDSRKLRIGPRHISKYGLHNDMTDLDGGFSWRKSNKQYFFKGDRFWRYDAKKQQIDPGYPKNINAWGGIPSNIDAVFQWHNNAVYFFKGQQFYRFDTRRITTVFGYPKKIQGDFVICPTDNKPARLSSKITVDQELSESANAYSKGTRGEFSAGLILFLTCFTIIKAF